MFEELGGAWPASYSRQDSSSYYYVTRGGGGLTRHLDSGFPKL